MADFIFTGPDGKQIRVTGPDGATLDDAQKQFGAFKQQHPELFKGDDQESVVMDFLKSMPRGAVRGLIEGTTSQALPLGPLVGAARQVGKYFTGRDPVAETEEAVSSKLNLPEPEGFPGRVGESIAETVANPAAYQGPGGLIA